MKSFMLALLVALSASAAVSGQVSPDQKSQWRRTIQYGTDTQVLGIVEKLKEANETSLGVELALILGATHNPMVQTGILDLFTQQKAGEGEAAARAILPGWRDSQSDVLISAMRYLAAIDAKGIANDLEPLVDSQDNAVAFEALGDIGKTRDRSVTKKLMDRLANPDFPESRKAQVILTLGELRDPAAKDALIAMVDAGDEDRTRRLYAADALGKIGDPTAIPSLKNLLNESDPLVRAYAASALTKFDVSLVVTELFGGLKDDNWKVRVECAKALAGPLPAGIVREAVDMLSYKAEFDPVSQVRLEALASLGKIPDEESGKLLMRIFSDQKKPLESREGALSALLERDLAPEEMDAIEKVVEEDRSKGDQRALLSEAKVFSTAKRTGLEPIFRILLDCPDVPTRLYAVRGVELNECSDLGPKLQEMSGKDPHPAVRKEAGKAVEKLSGGGKVE